MNRSVRHRPTIKKTHELSYALKVKEAMRRKVVTLRPTQSMEDVRRVLRNHRISGVPVVESQRVVGMISVEDLIKCLADGAMGTTIADKMSRHVVALLSDEPLIGAINKFDRYGFSRFPVLDRNTRELVGIITKRDIIQCLLGAVESLYHRKEDEEQRRYSATRLFEDLPSDWTTLVLKYHVAGGDFSKAGEKSDLLKGNLLKLGHSEGVIRRLIIAVFEAEMNVVIYTFGGDIVARVERGKITVNVTDNGPGIPDIELAMRPGYSTAPDSIRELGFGAGMGLPNIKKCTDEMKLESQVGKGTDLQFAVNV